LLDEFPYLVIVDALVTPGARLDFEGWLGGILGSNVQPDTKTIVHDLLEGFSRTPGLLLQLSAQVIIEG